MLGYLIDVSLLVVFINIYTSFEIMTFEFVSSTMRLFITTNILK